MQTQEGDSIHQMPRTHHNISHAIGELVPDLPGSPIHPKGISVILVHSIILKNSRP